MIDNILTVGKKVAIYIRHSTKKQDAFHQTETIKRVVQKYGLIAIETYYDNGKSCFRKPIEKRPELNKLLQNAESGAFEILLIYDVDRVVREVAQNTQIFSRLSELGINVIACSGGKPREVEIDTMKLILSGIRAESESDNISVRVYDSCFTRVANHGEWPGGVPPYGCYITKDHKIKFKPGNSENIEKIFRLYQLGLGSSKIADALPKGSYNGGNWTRYAVEGVIRNPIYAGIMSWGKRQKNNNSKYQNRELWKIETKATDVQPLISIFTFERCWDLYVKRKNGEISSCDYSGNYLLKGILACKCGSMMKTKDGRNKTKDKSGRLKTYGECYYYCPECGYHNVKIIHHIVDEKIWALFRSKYAFLPESQVFKKIYEHFGSRLDILNDRLGELMKSRTELKETETQIIDKIAEHLKIDGKNDQNLLAALDNERIRLKLEQDACVTQINKILLQIEKIEKYKNSKEYWEQEIKLLSANADKLKNYEKKYLIRQFIEEIILNGYCLSITFKWDLEHDTIDYRSGIFCF